MPTESPQEAQVETPGAESSKHTPGPWRVINEIPVNGECLDGVLGPDGKLVATAFWWFGTRSLPEAEANARLIAAAPDLYAAVKQNVDLMKTVATQEQMWNAHMALIKALARAEGGQP